MFHPYGKYPKQLLTYVSFEECFNEHSMESLLLGGRNYCGLTIVKPSFVKFRDGSETESTLFHCFTISKEAQFRWFLLAGSHSGWKCYLLSINMIYFIVIWISLVISAYILKAKKFAEPLLQ